MRENSKTELVHRFFSGTGPTYDHIVNLFTLGFDRGWKKKILAKIPEGSVRIMDQACGTGILTFMIAGKFPHGRITGVDLLEEYLDIAKVRARVLRLRNVEFILGRAQDVLLQEGFDCVTSSYLAKYVEIDSLIRNIKHMLRREGVLIMHDFTYPSSRTFTRVWELYFKMVQGVGSRKYPQWKTIFYGLPGLLRQTRWVTDLVRSLQENGFSEINVESLTFGTSAIVTARKI